MKDIIVTIARRKKMRRFYLICLSSLVLALLLAFHITPVYAETYTYDPAGRLTSVTYDDGYSISFDYDNAGNLLQRMRFIRRALADAVIYMQMLSGIEPPQAVSIVADVNEDNKIGLEEVIYILQKVSGLR